MTSVNHVKIEDKDIPFKIGGYALSLFLKQKKIKFSEFSKALEDDLTLLYEVLYLGVQNGYKREAIPNPFTLESFAELIDDHNMVNKFSELLSESMGGEKSNEKK
jgi:hypothetical protein